MFISNMVDKDDCDFVTRFMLDNEANLEKEEKGNNLATPGDYGVDADKTSKMDNKPPLLLVGTKILPLMERIAFRCLHPTYVYARLYRPGFILPCHRDRPSCEYSATITMGYGDRDKPWTFYADPHPSSDKNEREYSDLEVGDGWYYKGAYSPHGRAMLTEGWQAQAFFHFIEMGGEIYNKAIEAGYDMSIPWTDPKRLIWKTLPTENSRGSIMLRPLKKS